MGLEEWWNEMSEGEQEVFIDYMLDNEKLEKTIRSWDDNPQNTDTFMEMIYTFVDRINDGGAFVVALESNTIKPGVKNIEFATGNKGGTIASAVNVKENKVYAMLYTDKKYFERNCNDLSGLVMFIDDILEYIETIKNVDGVVINAGRDDIILGKPFIRTILWVATHDNRQINI